MRLDFCTLFDSNYMSRGIAMYQSLLKHCPEFQLYIVAFDNRCLKILKEMKLEKVTVISLEEFEDSELLRVKPTRTKAEYCWTSTSSVILYCLKKFSLQNCTYVDADLYFYQSPEILVNEIPEHGHVMITSHRYTWYYDQSKASGTYCVQFMYFDNTAESIEVLQRWRDQCIEWCYNRMEDGKFGDQKYLDEWPSKYKQVWELKNLGGGIAPWNVQQYGFDDIQHGTELKTGKKFNPVFYHFHGLRFYQDGKMILTPNTYRINSTVRSVFYIPYLHQLQKVKQLIMQFDSEIDPHGSRPSSDYFADHYVKGKLTFIYRNFLKRIFN